MLSTEGILTHVELEQFLTEYKRHKLSIRKLATKYGISQPKMREILYASNDTEILAYLNKHNHRKGAKLSEEAKQRCARYGPDNHFYGKKHSEYSKEQMSKSKIGQRKGVPPWNKGKHIHTEETKEKFRQLMIERNNRLGNPKPNDTWTEESHRKSSESHKKWCEENPEKLAKWINAGLDGSKGKLFDTKIELVMEEALQRYGIPYIKQAFLMNRFRVDFLIMDTLIVECDGDYWHSLPNIKKKDEMKDEQLTNAGWSVIRFKGSEILKSVDICVEYILRTYPFLTSSILRRPAHHK